VQRSRRLEPIPRQQLVAYFSRIRLQQIPFIDLQAGKWKIAAKAPALAAHQWVIQIIELSIRSSFIAISWIPRDRAWVGVDRGSGKLIRVVEVSDAHDETQEHKIHEPRPTP